MNTWLKGGRVYDPAQALSGQTKDLFLCGDRIRHALPEGATVDVQYNLDGRVVMAGAIDLHTHIGGGKANIARMLLPEMSVAVTRGKAIDPRCDPLLHPRADAFLPPAPYVGRRYLELGYTACFEPAMLASNARGTHAELADTPGIDTGAYVMLGNDDALLALMRDGVDQRWINAYVAAMVTATQAIGVKVVNPGGINAFKFNTRMMEVDTPHPTYGVTPGQIVRTLARAVDEIGLPQPLHVHASNLGTAGNVESALKTIAAADGHRIHLTHVQFHSYGNSGPRHFSSAAEAIARSLDEHPNLTIDVGQVMFGQTVTISADTMHQFESRQLARPRKSVIVDVECESGCGVVPFRYENRRYVNALQWAIGLELFLMVDDPSRIFLTTDHPNGGPFTTYPHLMRLLMDASFRETALAEIDVDAAAASQLGGISREYTLEEIAEMTRHAPARFLGLEDQGHLADGAIADVTVYQPDENPEKMFSRPTYVFRRGRLVVRDGVMMDSAPSVTHTVRPEFDASLLGRLRERIQPHLPLPFSLMGISDEEMRGAIGSPVVVHPNRAI